MRRCEWAKTELSIAYHDREWGVPLHDDRALFEFLVLEGAQAGLSWETVLKKRDAYRAAFDNFDARKIASYRQSNVRKLLADPGIIRNRLKIEAAIQNAKAFLAVQEEFASFDAYLWRFVGGHQKTRVSSAQGYSTPNPRTRRAEQGPDASRLQVRWLDHLLCLHAGRRDGERPARGLLQI